LIAASRRVAARLGGVSGHRDIRPVPGLPAGEVEVHVFRSPSQEAAFLAARFREAHLVEGVPWSAMAVLVRGATALPVVRRAFVAAGVPVALRREEVPLTEEPAVQPF